MNNLTVAFIHGGAGALEKSPKWTISGWVQSISI